MKCPHCNEEIKCPNYAWHNVTSYKESVCVTTECCYRIVMLIPTVSVEIIKAEGEDHGDGPEDYWGVPEGVAGKLAYEKLDEKIKTDHHKLEKLRNG